MKNYCVVYFKSTNDVATVSSNWLTDRNKSCFWPETKDLAKISRFVAKKTFPAQNWREYDIKVLHSYGESEM